MLTVAALLFVAMPNDLERFLEDPASVDRAALVASLRARGQAGLDDVLHVAGTGPSDRASARASARAARAASLVDDVAGQKHAAAVGAFWFTSLDDALKEAKRTHKPVLSLRLLGRLDEELSCANSRYFRSLVYPDAKVRALLREKFVLHWQSVRPAPKVTIDMGDGRTLVSTVTGNSAHMVLDENGAVVDAIPGLYAPPDFADALETALVIARAKPAERAQLHEKRVASLERRWAQLAPHAALPVLEPAVDATPQALDVARFAVTKAVPETRLLRGMAGRTDAPELTPVIKQLGLTRGAALKLPLDIFRTQLAPGVDEAAALAKTRAAMASDSLQNEYVFHRAVHRWLERGDLDDAALQKRLYDEIFQTPGDDPWLGLVPRDAYTGVAGGGVR